MPLRIDDPTIPDDEKLWRRILEGWLHKEPNGVVRPSSVAFIDRLSGEVSVNLGSETTPTHVLRHYPDDSLAEVRATVPRGLGHSIVRDQIVNDSKIGNDPSHALVCPPPTRTTNQRKSDARKMAGAAKLIVLRDPAVKRQSQSNIKEKSAASSRLFRLWIGMKSFAKKWSAD